MIFRLPILVLGVIAIVLHASLGMAASYYVCPVSKVTLERQSDGTYKQSSVEITSLNVPYKAGQFATINLSGIAGLGKIASASCSSKVQANWGELPWFQCQIDDRAGANLALSLGAAQLTTRTLIEATKAREIYLDIECSGFNIK